MKIVVRTALCWTEPRLHSASLVDDANTAVLQEPQDYGVATSTA